MARRLCGGDGDRDNLEARIFRVGRRKFVALTTAHGKAQFDRIARHGKSAFKVFALRYNFWKRWHRDGKAASFAGGTRFQDNGVTKLCHVVKSSPLA